MSSLKIIAIIRVFLLLLLKLFIVEGVDLLSRGIFVPKIIYEDIENFFFRRERLKKAYSRYKSYADNRRGDLVFEIGYQVYLKI